MPGSSLGSVDAQLAACADYGPWRRHWFDRVAANTAALSTCGGLSCARFPTPLTVPTPTAPVTGVTFPYCRGTMSSLGILVIGLEFQLAHFKLGTGFTQDLTMPSRWVKGQTIQLAASLLFITVDIALTGTAITPTITYTNQAGTGGQTAAPVLPAAAAINSAYLLAPHLASGDTGVRAVTNISTAGGTAGTISVRGLLPLGICIESGAGAMGSSCVDPMSISMVPWIAAGGDIIAAYACGTSGSTMDMEGMIVGVGDY